MGDRRNKRRRKPPKQPAEVPFAKVFAEHQCRPDDFHLEYGSGKSFLSGQRVLWMKIQHVPSGWKASMKCGTSKRQVEQDAAKVLRSLLRDFTRGRKSN